MISRTRANTIEPRIVTQAKGVNKPIIKQKPPINIDDAEKKQRKIGIFKALDQI